MTADKLKKILIVEDEQALARTLSVKLKNADFAVDIANDGKSGLDLTDKNQYDLIVLDLMMPEMNGFEVMKALKEKGNKAPIIVASNLSQAEDEDKVKDLGAIEYFVKSNSSLSTIVEKIQNILK